MSVPTRLTWALPILGLSLVFAAPQEGSARGPALSGLQPGDGGRGTAPQKKHFNP